MFVFRFHVSIFIVIVLSAQYLNTTNPSFITCSVSVDFALK